MGQCGHPAGSALTAAKGRWDGAAPSHLAYLINGPGTLVATWRNSTAAGEGPHHATECAVRASDAAVGIWYMLSTHASRPAALPGDRSRLASVTSGPPAASATRSRSVEGALPTALPPLMPPPPPFRAAPLLLRALPLPAGPAGGGLAMNSRFSGRSRGTRAARVSKPSGCRRHQVGCLSASRPASPMAPLDLWVMDFAGQVTCVRSAGCEMLLQPCWQARHSVGRCCTHAVYAPQSSCH